MATMSLGVESTSKRFLKGKLCVDMIEKENIQIPDSRLETKLSNAPSVDF